MTADGEGALTRIAQALAHLRRVPSGVLARKVTDSGACMQVSTDDGPPHWLHQADSDRELAARLCQGCPVQRECLELELRVVGDQTVGVWGALGEDDRRALVPHWRRLSGEPSQPVAGGVGPGRGER